MKITDKRIGSVVKSIRIGDIPCGTYFTGHNAYMNVNESYVYLRYFDGILVVDNPECNWDVESLEDQPIDNYQPLDVEIIIHGPISE